MNVQLRDLAARQSDLVASWQLLAAGWSRDRINHHRSAGSWRSVHRGVYVLSHGPLTRHQRWLAATLTAPGTFLSLSSAGAKYGFRSFDRAVEMVTRHGSGGRKRVGNVLVCRSTTLAGHTTVVDGIPITTAERTLIDLAPHLHDKAIKRAFREALRLKTTTARRIAAALTDLQRPRGTALLGELATRYADIPYARTRSDAEGLALEQLHDAGAQRPSVNVKVGGEEADLVFHETKTIVGIDGPQYHRFPGDDARKDAAWGRAGYVVRRVSSDGVYESPEELLARASYPARP